MRLGAPKRPSMRRASPPTAIALLLAIVAGLAVSPSHAAVKRIRKTHTYAISGPIGTTTRQPDRTCALGDCVTGDPNIRIGGTRFDPIGPKGTASVSVTVQDGVNPAGKVRVTVCDAPATTTRCGDGSKQSIDTCVAPKQQVKLLNVPRAHQIIVIVWSAWGCPVYLVPDIADPGVATTGTITAVWTYTA